MCSTSTAVFTWAEGRQSNQLVKKTPDIRIRKDFAFQVTLEEYDSLRSQFATLEESEKDRSERSQTATASLPTQSMRSQSVTASHPFWVLPRFAFIAAMSLAGLAGVNAGQQISEDRDLKELD